MQHAEGRGEGGGRTGVDWRPEALEQHEAGSGTTSSPDLLIPRRSIKADRIPVIFDYIRLIALFIRLKNIGYQRLYGVCSHLDGRMQIQRFTEFEKPNIESVAP